MRTLLLILDLAGTFVFALAGATAAARRQLDIFGVLAVAFAAACSGGIARDVLIGAVPPAAIVDWRYLAPCLAAGGIAFRWPAPIARMANPVRVIEAAGPALLAVAGAHKALSYELNASMAAFMGMRTGIGGGVVRDLLLAQIPIVLRSELYAVAALAGAAVVVVGAQFELPPSATAIGGALLCFTLRMLAIRRGWHLPKPLHASIRLETSNERMYDETI